MISQLFVTSFMDDLVIVSNAVCSKVTAQKNFTENEKFHENTSIVYKLRFAIM